MKIMCAWCDKDMGEKDGEGIEGVSHSICDVCLNRLESEIKHSLAIVSKEQSQG